jgi:hypothetical protein
MMLRRAVFESHLSEKYEAANGRAVTRAVSLP